MYGAAQRSVALRRAAPRSAAPRRAAQRSVAQRNVAQRIAPRARARGANFSHYEIDEHYLEMLDLQHVACDGVAHRAARVAQTFFD